jgi:ion channel-forming bestrophin family protein
MIISKNISLINILKRTGLHILLLLLYTGFVTLLYRYNIIYFEIPWLPVSVIGTAVAFYVGFKNNQAYDRMWEARKIWGGIINESRTWGMMIDNFVTNSYASTKLEDDALHEIKKRLIYRHMGWMYAHRSQLLVPTPWEHISQKGFVGYTAKHYVRKYGIGMIEDEISRKKLQLFLPSDEYQRLINYRNTATQIINEQSRDLKILKEQGLIDNFRHIELSRSLKQFYNLQGKNERIKKFPLPRQYANMSRIFVWIFIGLLPFSMVPELIKIGYMAVWASIPVTALIGWVYMMMEVVGDYSENPFQGMSNDIPMLSLCRTIEIDLREMLGETELPPIIKAKNGILM